MIITVTGGSGLIGLTIIKQLLEKGHKVVSFDLAEQHLRKKDFIDELKQLGDLTTVSGSILDRTALRAACRGVDAVYHLAAMLGVRNTEENRLVCVEVNVTGTNNVLEACAMNGVKKVIFASSSEVYGEPSSNPITENHELKGKSVYSMTKMLGEEIVKGYAELYPNLQYTITRFFNTYGEGQVAQFVLSKFVKKVLDGENPVVYGDGSQKRSYGHVEDVANGLLTILENPASDGKTYNIGNSSQIMTLKELAQKVIDVLAPDKGLEVEVLGDFDNSDRVANREIHNRWCDTSLIEKDLGYKPQVTVEEGIRRIAEHGPIHNFWPSV